MSDANTREPDLLIIRRGGSAELETPKGGVWKIAYADFMTAMMAFFLVMWLINATSETTKTGVANYFNPIKLADGMQLPRKGLQDPEHSEQSDSEAEYGAAEEEPEQAEASEAEKSKQATSEKAARFTEEALFRDPYAVLAAIAAEAEGTTSIVARGDGYGSVGAGGEDRAGETYGDPFDPAAWQVTAAPADAERQLEAAYGAGESWASGATAEGETFESQPVGNADLVAEGLGDELAGQMLAYSTEGAATAEATEQPEGGAGEEEGASDASVDAVAGEITAGEITAGEITAGEIAAGEIAAGEHAGGDAGAGARAAGDRRALGAGRSPSGEQAPDGSEAARETLSLQQRIAEAMESGSRQMPSVTVRNADGGVLISLADQVAFGMFAVGSAEPLPETIAVMEKIAALLNTLPGKVIIRGHTDGRPFRSLDYDNWRLSSARAHMAYHMLVRGGLDESRVERIEGYADRDLKLPDDPDAAENRRIDILVQEVHS